MADPALIEELDARVRQRMPIRCLKLPEMQVVTRPHILTYLTRKVARLDSSALRDIVIKKRTGQQPNTVDTSFEQSKTLLIKAIVNDLTAYAILSHTWQKDEVEFNHLENRDGSYFVPEKMEGTGLGLKKLKDFCSHACDRHQKEFAWMDTVCINKGTTTGELIESIRSMFKWYSDASICMVYLAETTTIDEAASDRWFSRGWTLQELLAPRRVAFYNSVWVDLGAYNKDAETLAAFTSSGLCRFIQNGTGIRPQELHGFSPGIGQFGVAARMRWIARRETSQEEDIAYSIMGIFGVAFDAQYGEKKEAAFCRLMQAIANSYPKENIMWIFNYAGKSNSSSTVTNSRILPSSPECYNHNNATLNDILSDQHRRGFRVESSGISISLLLLLAMPPKYNQIRGEEQNQRRRDNPNDIEVPDFSQQIGQPFPMYCEQNDSAPVWVTTPVFVSLLNDKVQDRTAFKSSNCFVFGIWTFEDRETEVIIPSQCSAFLFHSTPAIDATCGIAIWDVTEKEICSTTKVDTKDVIILKTLAQGKKRFFKKDLPLYGMQYITAIV